MLCNFAAAQKEREILRCLGIEKSPAHVFRETVELYHHFRGIVAGSHYVATFAEAD